MMEPLLPDTEKYLSYEFHKKPVVDLDEYHQNNSFSAYDIKLVSYCFIVKDISGNQVSRIRFKKESLEFIEPELLNHFPPCSRVAFY